MNYNKLLEFAEFSPRSLNFPNSWIGHIPFAAWVVQEVRPSIFVELGTHTGNSYFAFCQAVAEAHISTQCYAVDTWRGDEHAGLYEDNIFNKVNDYNQKNYAGFSKLLRMTFDEAISCFADGSVGLLHIDGLHTYEAVRHDFESWLPKLAPGAVVLFHDTNVHERNFGVAVLWKELQKQYQNNIEFLHSQGLGVLQLDNGPEDKKLQWFNLDPLEQQKVLDYFSELGLRRLECFELKEIKQRVAMLELSVADRDKIITNLSETKTKNTKRIASLKQQLQYQQTKINELYRYITEETKFKGRLFLNKKNIRKWRGYYRLLKELKTQPLLDSQWYLTQYQDVKGLNISPIRHYYFYGAREGRDPSPYFFTRWYLSEYPDVDLGDLNPLLHYLTNGSTEGRNPNPYFDSQWYLSVYPDVARSGVNPLFHYLDHGIDEGRNPNPYFDSLWYSSAYQEVAEAGMDPLLHYLKFGVEDGRNPGPYFDNRWYLEEYPEVAALGIDPFLHYLKYGLEEGKSPNPYFDAQWYINEYPEVAALKIDPFLHYLRHGVAEGKDPSPYFDTRRYLREYHEVSESGLHPLLHFMTYGIEEGRNPNGYFDTRWYLTQYPDVAISGMNPLLHYIKHGVKEGRNPSPYFDSLWYLAEYPEVARCGMNPLHHYLRYGVQEGRRLLLVHTVIPGYEQARNGRRSTFPLALQSQANNDGRSGEKISFDLVLITYNSEKWIEACLTSLVPHNENIKITVVDNGSTDQSVAQVESFLNRFSALRLIKNKSNKGFGAANNQAALAATCNYLVFLNIDTELHDMEAFSKLRNIIASSNIDVAAWEFRQLPYEHPKCYDPVSLETSWCSGAAVVVKREAYQEVGGFDENLFMYCEDVDLSWRLRAKGYRLLYCPSVTVTHHCYSKPGEVKPLAQYYGVRNNYFLRSRFGSDLEIRIGRDLLLRYLRYVEKHSPPTLYNKLAEIKNASEHFKSTRWEPNRFFRPFFDGYDYEIRREGSFYVNTLAEQNPMVSIIVRTIGRLHYLEHAFYSIINQTYRNVEIVVVEDGSSNAQDLVSSFHGYNVVYRSTDKVGRCQAGNIGLSIASGDFFNFLDEDDLLYCDHVETLVNALLKNPQYGAVWSSAFCVSTIEAEDGTTCYDMNYQIAHTVEPDKDSILERNHFPIQSVLFRRECYEELGGFDTELDLLEDWDFWIRYLTKYRFKRIPKTTSLYRIPHEKRAYDIRKKNLDQYYDRIRMKYQKIL